MPTSPPPPRLGRRLTTVGLLAVLAVALLFAVPGLRPVLRDLGDVSPLAIAVAIALELASCLSFVVIFRLFFAPVPAREARAIAWTEMSSGALLPGGGAGGLAVGGWLMSLTGAKRDWIIRRSSGLFFLTSGMNSLAIIGAALILLTGAAGSPRLVPVLLPLVFAVLATAAVASLPWLTARRRRPAPVWLAATVAGIADAKHTAAHPSWRLLGAPGYLLFDIAVLWTSLAALGHPPSPAAVVLGYLIGYLANALPIPGGIGVLDAGITGALLLYGVSPAHALTAVLIYHAIAFWLPALGGLFAYARLRGRLLTPRAEAARIAAPPTPSPTRGSHDRLHPHPCPDAHRMGGTALRRTRARALPRDRCQATRGALPGPRRPRVIGRHRSAPPAPRVRMRRLRILRRAV